VHLIAHSHDDVGWLKTVDGYFSGTKVDIQTANVEMTLDTTIAELLKDPNRRYTQVEMKFFSMWWKNQNEEIKAAVRAMTKEGRLEFVNAGWSMHDEACTHYEDMVNNMIIGNDFLMQEVGVKPRIGWQIDPFGHSNANARLYAEMGFDAVFFARADYQDFDRRFNESEMEWLWRPFFNHLGKRTQILAHLMANGNYCPP
jgi:alpha-mannosidase